MLDGRKRPRDAVRTLGDRLTMLGHVIGDGAEARTALSGLLGHAAIQVPPGASGTVAMTHAAVLCSRKQSEEMR